MANITHYYSEEFKNYIIKDYDLVKVDYEHWIADNVHVEVVLANDEDYKRLYKERTNLRKEIDNLKKDKKTIDGIILGTFDTQVGELISMLNKVDEQVTAKLEDYKPKEPVYEIKFKTKNKEHYEKVMALINELKGENEDVKV